MLETKALTIGDLAARTGLSVSAIRFYEDKGPGRTLPVQRRPAAVFALGHPPPQLRPDRPATGVEYWRNPAPARQATPRTHANPVRLDPHQQGDARGD